MSTLLLQTKSRNVLKFLPLFSQYHKNGLFHQIPYSTFKLIQPKQSQSLAFLIQAQKIVYGRSQDGNSGNGENRNSSTKFPEIFLISALLLCHCEDDKGETVFTKKEFWFFHYFLRSIGRHGLRQGANDIKKRNKQPFEEDTVSQILTIIKDGDEIKDLSVKVLDQLIIYAEEVIQHFEKKEAKLKSKSSESNTAQKYSERLVQWKEILQLLEQQRNAKK